MLQPCLNKPALDPLGSQPPRSILLPPPIGDKGLLAVTEALGCQKAPLPLQHCGAVCTQSPIVETMSTLQVHQNYHQDSEATINCQIDPELCASYLYLSMSYYFDLNDVTLRNIAKYFLHQSHKEREHAEKPMKLQNQQRGWIFFQDIKKPVMTGRMG